MQPVLSNWIYQYPIIFTTINKPDAINIILNLFVALGTISLAVITVFQDRIRRCLQKPVLKLEYRNKEPDSQFLPVKAIYDKGAFDIINSYFIRIRVWNDGNEIAEKPEVFIASIIDKETKKEISSFIPINLEWTHYQNILNPSIYSIPSGSYRLFDLGYFPFKIEKHSSNGSIAEIIKIEKNLFVFSTIVKPISEYNPFNRISNGAYIIELHISAANCKTVKRKIEISFTETNPVKEVKIKINK